MRKTKDKIKHIKEMCSLESIKEVNNWSYSQKLSLLEMCNIKVIDVDDMQKYLRKYCISAYSRYEYDKVRIVSVVAMLSKRSYHLFDNTNGKFRLNVVSVNETKDGVCIPIAKCENDFAEFRDDTQHYFRYKNIIYSLDNLGYVLEQIEQTK